MGAKKKVAELGIEELTRPYDTLPGDCGDITRVLHMVLVGAGVKHRVMLGYLLDQRSGEQYAPHLWVELADGRVVDYRARVWLGNKEYVPHGVFRPALYPGVEHHGREVKISTHEPQKLRVCIQMWASEKSAQGEGVVQARSEGHS